MTRSEMMRRVSITMTTLFVAGLLSCAVPGAADAAAVRATTKPVAVDQSTPRGAVKVFAIAVQSGQADKLREVLEAASPAEEQVVGAMGDAAAAAAVLRAAATEKFGAEAARAMAGGPPTVGDIDKVDWAAERVDGDRATVDLGGGAVAMRLVRRREAGWRIAVGGLVPVDDPKTGAKIVPGLRALARTMTETAGEIRAGRYKSAAEAKEVLTTRTQAAVAAALAAAEAAAATQPSTGGAPGR